MSRSSSHSEVRATDSQDLDHLESLSLPSEPPDIRNWFPSYVYESPELNTLDGFQDSDGSAETCVEEAKNEKSDDALLAASKNSSDGIEFNESTEFECSKSATMVAGSSESLSFPSEPPDIKNWFSSYFYESPPLDTTHDFAISDYKESEDGKLCDVQKSYRQEKKDIMAFIDVEESTDLCSQSRISDAVVTCTNLVKDTKLDYQSACKDLHSTACKPMSSIRSQLTSDDVSDTILSGQRTANSNHGSVKMSGNMNAYGKKDNNGKLHGSLINGGRPMSMNVVENNINSLDGQSVHKSIGRINPIKDSVEKEDLDEIVSCRTLELTVPKGDSRGRPIDRRSNEKENVGNELLEDGFISIIKKSSQQNAGNVTRRGRVEVESLRNAVEPKTNHEKDAKIVRKVLSEISNFRSSNIQEKTGKWSCPQKNKPDLGPPLKQLRLNQWFYRV